MAKDVLSEAIETKKNPEDIVSSKGLSQITDTAKIEEVVKLVIVKNEKSVKDYKLGKTNALTFLIGQVMKEAKDKVMVPKNTFLAAVKRAALFTNQDSAAIKIDLGKDKLVISKSTPYLGEARVEVDAEYKGKEISVGFNPDYLVDVLKNINEEVVNFEVSDPEKPGVIRVGSDYVYVVLPMQL